MYTPNDNYERVTRFFIPLLSEYKAYKKWTDRIDRELAARFNLVGIWLPGEVQLSSVIANLLDPVGSHGQGSAYLRLFLKELDCCDDGYSLDQARVSLEYVILGRRRIDILIKIPSSGGGYILGIENKPWAGEQDNQIGDYCKGVRSLPVAKNPNWKWSLLYLTSDGRDPSTATQERDKDHLICRSYPDLLLPWLRECQGITEVDKLRHFIRDFIAWIHNSFPSQENNK